MLKKISVNEKHQKYKSKTVRIATKLMIVVPTGQRKREGDWQTEQI